MTWTATGYDRHSPVYPPPVEVGVVVHLLSDEQRRALLDYAESREFLAAARTEAGRRDAAVAEAEQTDMAGALAAAEAHEGIAPASLVPGAAAAAEAARRYVRAMETMCARYLQQLHDALMPDQPRLVELAWAAVDADNRRKPEVTRKLVAATLWALTLEDGPEAPDDGALAVLELPSVEELRAAHNDAVSDALDALGGAVAGFFAEPEQVP